MEWWSVAGVDGLSVVWVAQVVWVLVLWVLVGVILVYVWWCCMVDACNVECSREESIRQLRKAMKRLRSQINSNSKFLIRWESRFVRFISQLRNINSIWPTAVHVHVDILTHTHIKHKADRRTWCTVCVCLSYFTTTECTIHHFHNGTSIKMRSCFAIGLCFRNEHNYLLLTALIAYVYLYVYMLVYAGADDVHRLFYKRFIIS